MNGLDFGTIVLSSIISGGIAYGVAWYFRYYVKPKSEIVFDDNRNSNLKLIFNLIDMFDFQFEGFLLIFETRLGDLTPDRVRMIPFYPTSKFSNADIQKMWNDFPNVLKDVAKYSDEMKKIFDEFLDDYKIYHNYLHDSFLRDVKSYFFSVLYYTDWLKRKDHVPQIIVDRKKTVRRIISYIESDKSINKESPEITRFFTRWKPLLD